MKGGGGKRKGSKFERQVCKALSLWVSAGKSTDVFWRSAMSGGRATVQGRRGVKVRQVGDICAVSDEGFELTNQYFIECKNIKDLGLTAFVLSNKGPLAKHWAKAVKQAEEHGREPMLIVRSKGPILVFTRTKLDWADPILESWPRDCEMYTFSSMIASRYSYE